MPKKSTKIILLPCI